MKKLFLTTIIAISACFAVYAQDSSHEVNSPITSSKTNFDEYREVVGLGNRSIEWVISYDLPTQQIIDVTATIVESANKSEIGSVVRVTKPQFIARAVGCLGKTSGSAMYQCFNTLLVNTMNECLANISDCTHCWFLLGCE